MILSNIYNMESDRGNAIPNQFVTVGDYDYNFYSYGSFIIGIDRNKKLIQVGQLYNYSRTTSKYRNKFLREQGFNEIADIKSLDKAISDGQVDINGTTYKVERYYKF